MDLWIRSQDKKDIMKVDAVCMELDYYDETTYSIYGFLYEDKVLLGIYRTEERALEVLDEIYSKLDTGFNFNGIFTEMDIYIKGKMLAMMVQRYEMPEE